MKILLTTNGKSIAATLADTQIADEFIAMLPLTITMYDFLGREKFGALPVGVTSSGIQSRAYEIGDIVCWAPGPDLSILYRQDGRPLDGAWHFLGRIDEAAEAFGEPGTMEVTIGAAPKAEGLATSLECRSCVNAGLLETAAATTAS
ncbi:cyclophilin-like fold protein [Variovorax sp. RHLX14]|uniref:cyclophilin-like fold protein n=1 Tax=Variovorax sp. RHLX14 TaxID=1259731 RepID=UPI003F4799C7